MTIESFQKNEAEVKSFLMKQESAPTIQLFGPTKSAKSTAITELLCPASNKLLGYNVGEDAQTTLIRLVLMLNQRLSKTQVIVKCVPHKNEETMFMIFLTEFMRSMTTILYDKRDELEEFVVDEEFVKRALNPQNRSFHCFDFAQKKDMTNKFKMIVSSIVQNVIEEPELLSDKADEEYKQRRKIKKELKKIEVYEELIQMRFHSNEEHRKAIREWFDKLKEALFNEFQNNWHHVIKSESGKIEGYVICDEINEEDSGIIGQIIRAVYEKESAYSLVFSEVHYVTTPSEQFIEQYELFCKRDNPEQLGRKLKINIIDTMGITQSSTQKEEISSEMDKIFQRESDAYLFLCATNEMPTTYDECIDLLQTKKKSYEKKVFVICRTKADEIIRNKMVNNWRRDTGKNEIEDEQYDTYLRQAFEEFKEQMIRSDKNVRSTEYAICNQLPIEFLCTAPDRSKEMRKVLTGGELESSKIYRILYDIMNRIDSSYGTQGKRLWLYSKDLNHKPLHIKCKAHELNETICTALIACNMQQRNQYLQYDKKEVTYHWNSVYCFWDKLRYGNGHETRANVYGSFRLFQKNMVESWLRRMIPMEDMLNDIEISFEYLDSDPKTVEDVKTNFPTQFRKMISISWVGILDRVARKLTYDCLQPRLDEIFTQNYYDNAFKISLRYFNEKFSDKEYWKSTLLRLLLLEFDEILQKMYIFDEV